jgi:hypothetical protein
MKEAENVLPEYKAVVCNLHLGIRTENDVTVYMCKSRIVRSQFALYKYTITPSKILQISCTLEP